MLLPNTYIQQNFSKGLLTIVTQMLPSISDINTRYSSRFIPREITSINCITVTVPSWGIQNLPNKFRLSSCLTMPRIASYHIISYHIISYHIISYHICLSKTLPLMLYTSKHSIQMVSKYCRIAVLILDAGLLARSQYPCGPATGHLDTGFSWFPCVYKRMLRWFPSFQVATTCLSCSPPDLNFLVTFFHICVHVK